MEITTPVIYHLQVTGRKQGYGYKQKLFWITFISSGYSFFAHQFYIFHNARQFYCYDETSTLHHAYG